MEGGLFSHPLVASSSLFNRSFSRFSIRLSFTDPTSKGLCLCHGCHNLLSRNASYRQSLPTNQLGTENSSHIDSYRMTMQQSPPVPPNPLIGILAWGFVFLFIYAFVRLANEGEGRYHACKRAIIVGLLGIIIVALLESIYFWSWNLQNTPLDVSLFLVWGVTMMFGLIFIVVPVIDLAVQRLLLRQ